MYLYANFDGTGISFLQNIPTDNFDWTLNSVKTIINLKFENIWQTYLLGTEAHLGPIKIKIWIRYDDFLNLFWQ